MNHPDALAIMQAAFRRRQPELEAFFRMVFLDMLELPEDQRLGWDDLTSSMAALMPVEAEACASAIEALWLDKSFERGFTVEPPEGSDG